MLFFILLNLLLNLDPTTPAAFPAPDSPPESPPTKSYAWEGCDDFGKCPLADYTDPPLVIISMDGFARDYLEKRIVTTLEKIAECGVKAERVYPSFPSKTFPNHFTMVTGLFPDVHGIIDNNVMDIKIAPKLASMQTTKIPQYYDAEPLWSAYKRVTGKKANCFFWPGCALNGTFLAPDVSPKYNKSITFKQRLDTVIKWLQLPIAERPGLVNVYYHEPDSAGHKQKTPKDVEKMLRTVEEDLDYFMENLKKANLLECINLAIVSDHGMELLHKKYYFDDILKDVKEADQFVTSSGVMGRIHLMSSGIDAAQLASTLKCKENCEKDGYKVYTRADVPTRKHYGHNTRIGEVILEGDAGVAFFKNEADDKKKFNGDHGYDYLNPHVQTIFFARGPSFRQNVTVQPFQNVQYMNLWLTLLKIDGKLGPNNGTIGFFDDILNIAPERAEVEGSHTIPECDSTISSRWKPDYDSQDDEVMKVLCDPWFMKTFLDNVCTITKNCVYQIIPKNEEDVRRAVVEKWIKNQTELAPTDTVLGVFGGFEPLAAKIDLPKSFLENVMLPIRSLTEQFTLNNSIIYSISGIATDEDRDGRADDKGTTPTHFYRVYIACRGVDEIHLAFYLDPRCKYKHGIEVLSFIFPIMEIEPRVGDKKEQFLLDYTATIFDVEMITGFQIEIPELTAHQNVLLRRRVPTKLEMI